MKALRVVCEVASAAALGLWAGALAMVGVMAAIAFPMMRDLDPSLPGYAAYDGEHWRIAAGSILDTAFGIGDLVGVVLLGVAILCAAVLAKLGGACPRTRLGVVRWVTLLIAAMVTVYVMGALRPEMNGLTEDHFTNAAAGRNAAAGVAREAFDALHGTASNLHIAQLGAGFIALVVSVFGAASFRERSE